MTDAYQIWDTLKKKMKRWREENQGSRTFWCPHCVKPILLRIRSEAWETQKHPFFIDRFLANKHLMYLYKIGRLEKEDIAKVLETSVDYIEWLLEKVFSKNFRRPKELIEEEIQAKQKSDELESGQVIEEIVDGK